MQTLCWVTWDLSLQHADSLVVAHGLCYSIACEILVPRPGIECVFPALQGGDHQGSPKVYSLCCKNSVCPDKCMVLTSFRISALF